MHLSFVIKVGPTSMYMVASKCSRNRFISDKYRILHTFELYFLENNPLYNNTLLPATIKLLETFLEDIS